MTRTNWILAVSVGLVCTLAACSDTRAPLSPAFGDAVRHNQAAHIIDPNPDTAEAGAPDMNGPRAQGAYGRYEAGTVFEPEADTDFGGGGGGS